MLTLTAALIGVLVGFAVVPGLRPEPLRHRIVAARTKTARALRAMTERDRADDPEVLVLHRAAAQARAELTPDREKLDDDQLAELDRFRAALRDLSMLGTTAALGGTAGTERLRAALDALEAPAPDDGEAPAGLESIAAGLADQVRTSEERLLAALPER